MSNTPTRRDAQGRKFWRGPHALSMAAARQRRLYAEREAAAAARAEVSEDAPVPARQSGKSLREAVVAERSKLDEPTDTEAGA